MDSDETLAIALADVDADGDNDIVLADGFAPFRQNRLYLNEPQPLGIASIAFTMPNLASLAGDSVFGR